MNLDGKLPTANLISLQSIRNHFFKPMVQKLIEQHKYQMLYAKPNEY